MTSRNRSGSSRAASWVDPAMSANRTVTTFRSSPASSSSWATQAPQRGQNRASGGSGVPHRSHVRALTSRRIRDPYDAGRNPRISRIDPVRWSSGKRTASTRMPTSSSSATTKCIRTVSAPSGRIRPTVTGSSSGSPSTPTVPTEKETRLPSRPTGTFASSGPAKHRSQNSRAGQYVIWHDSHREARSSPRSRSAVKKASPATPGVYRWRIGIRSCHRITSFGSAIFSNTSRPPEARLARTEVPDVEDRAASLLVGRPHRLDRQTDGHVLRRHLTELVHEADPPRGAVDLDHRGELLLLQGLHVPPDVADRERIHDAGVLDLHPSIGGTEALLAEHPRGDQDAPAPPALPRQDNAAPQAPEVLADGHARVPGVPGVDLPVDRTHGLAEGRVLQRGGPQGVPRRRAVVAIGHRPITTTVPTCMRSPHAWATPLRGSPGTCRLPAWPDSCQYSSAIFISPAAAMGLPTPSNPPEGVDGRSPSRFRTPSLMASGAFPLSNSMSPSRWWSSL